MKFRKLAIAAALATIFSATLSLADTVVRVSLIDKMGAPELDGRHQLGMAMKGNMAEAKMGIKANPATARRGMVKFDVTNLASSIVHEVIIARIDDEGKLLPFDEGRNKVDVEGMQMRGSLNEIEPSKSASISLNLEPGKYLLFCNIAGHYMSGMWTVVEVQ